jgi:CheY-like chemotaxis protein
MTEPAVRVLIVDDDALMRAGLRGVLSADPGIEVVGTAPNGKLALTKLAQLAPDLLTMDIEMPEMNGIEATAAIRRTEANGGVRLPIVGVTAHALKGDRERCIEAGMDDYLPKPISPKALLDKVEKWIRPDGASKRIAG